MPNRISRELALPLDLYGDQAVFDMEVAEIWHRDWVFATTVDALAEPGDFVPVAIGRQNVIVVRGEDFHIRAFLNACSHRGEPLVQAPGSALRFSCPYHAWTYDTEGQLLSVPYANPDEIDRSQHGLVPVAAEQWHGLVFVNLSAEPTPLADRLQVIEPYVSQLGIQRLHHDSTVSDEVWAANWKAVFSNAVDTYSHFRVHAETIEPFSPTDATYYLAGSADATVTGGESGERADHLIVSIPPSFVAVVYPDAMLWQAFVPLAVDRTRVLIGVAGEATTTNGEIASLPGWDPGFIDEDRVICEQLQTNAATPAPPGPLLSIERALGDFHDYLAWRLTGREPDPAVVAALPGDRPDPDETVGL